MGKPYFSIVALSRLHVDARREWQADPSSAGAKLTGEQRRLGVPERSSEKDSGAEKEMVSGFV